MLVVVWAAPLAAQTAASRSSGLDTVQLRAWLTSIAGPASQGRANGSAEHARVVATLREAGRALGLRPPGGVETRVPLRRVEIQYDRPLALSYRPLPRWDPRVGGTPPSSGFTFGPPLVTHDRHFLPGWDWVMPPPDVWPRYEDDVAVSGATVRYVGRLGVAAAERGDTIADRVIVLDPPVNLTAEEALAHDSLGTWLASFSAAAAIAITGLDAVDPAVRARWLRPVWTMGPLKRERRPPLFVLSRRTTRALLLHPDLVMTASLRVRERAPSAPIENLSLLLPGRAPESSREVIVLSAPSDGLGVGPDGSLYPGADDGGSGAAALLGVAALLQDPAQRPARSVLFVWHAATELGLLGSDWWWRQAPVPLDRIAAVINVERLARGADTLYAVGALGTTSSLADLVTAYAGQSDLTLSWAWDTPDDPWQRPCRSDHVRALAAGVPALTINSGVHADWRRPTDHVERIEMSRYVARIQWLAGAVRAVAEAPRGSLVRGSAPSSCEIPERRP